ncbi:trehalose-phosphatase [Salinigranum sp. GCM10025319]|uniref:trehalose-phosphatase n=1 Tax=Salinigranum sp. GCM10025319 TaxID=3252687 RepID=UPI0036215F5E
MSERGAPPEAVSERGAPPEVWSRIDELGRWLDGSDGLVLGVDFDGTLAPIADDHREPTLDPSAHGALRALAAVPSIHLAVVSGRSRADLTARVGVDGAVYAGNHGLELVTDDGAAVHSEAAGLGPTVRRACDELDDRLGDISGCVIERKGVTATVHFRRVHDDAVPEVTSTVEEVASAVDGIRVTAGKRVRELRPAVQWDKGETMRLLRESAPDGWRTMYVGDDTTDEDAFRAIRPDGIGVYVADDGDGDGDRRTETAASDRLGGQSDVVRLLVWLADRIDSRSSAAGATDAREAVLATVVDREPFTRVRSSPSTA